MMRECVCLLLSSPQMLLSQHLKTLTKQLGHGTLSVAGAAATSAFFEPHYLDGRDLLRPSGLTLLFSS